MAGVISTGNHPKALWPGIKSWYGRMYEEHTEEQTNIFRQDSSDKQYEEMVELTGFGLAPVKPQAQATSYDSETQGDVSRSTHVAYSLGYIVTREELDDCQYEVVSKRRSQALAFSSRQTKENVGANVINRAFNSNFVGGDGVELISASHVTKTGLQSNHLSPAADFSETSMEDLIIQIMGATNSRGLKINLMPKKLHVPRQLWFEANRVYRSVLQNDTANNAVNVLNATNAIPDGIFVNHYFTDVDAFFLTNGIPSGLTCYNRIANQFTMDNDFDTENAKAKFYERYSFTWGDWRDIYGSPGV